MDTFLSIVVTFFVIFMFSFCGHLLTNSEVRDGGTGFGKAFDDYSDVVEDGLNVVFSGAGKLIGLMSTFVVRVVMVLGSTLLFPLWLLGKLFHHRTQPAGESDAAGAASDTSK
jgi:hypothetical protein